MKVPEFKQICDDLGKVIDGKTLQMHLYEKKAGEGINIFVQQLVPIQVERKLEFMLS